MAVVGGANLIFNPEYYLYYSNQKFLSPDGKCKSFDARGDGFGRGEGLGAVILKPCKWFTYYSSAPRRQKNEVSELN